MATIVNRRRGTTAQHAAFTGAIGETTYDTDIKRLVAHDGVAVGGLPAAHLHVNNLFSIQQRITSTANAPQLIITTAPAQSTQAFQIFQPDGTTQLFGVNFSGTTEVYRQSADTSGAALSHFKRGTTGSATAAVASGDQLSQDNYFGWTGAAFAASAQIRVSAREAFTPTTLGSQFEFRTPAIGSTVQTLVATLNTSQLEISSRLLLPNTTSATVGGIYFGGNRAFHNFGTNNTFVGVNSGNLTLTGTGNSFFGIDTGTVDTTGSNNSFFGRSAGAANTTGGNNSFFGSLAGLVNTTGGDNSFFGFRAGTAHTTGTFNSFFGSYAGAANTTGVNNSLFGFRAGVANTTGTRNSFFGAYAGQTNTTGIRNSFFGHAAGFANTTGSYNSFFGQYAGVANTTGYSNSFFGLGAGQANTAGINNSFFGRAAGLANTTANNNSFFGQLAGTANTTGAYNSFFGRNTAMANTTGARNTFFGSESGSLNTTGNNNLLIGYRVGNNLTTGNSNIVLGYDIDVPVAAGSNQLSIGNLIFGTGIDGTGTTISTGNVGIGVITALDKLHVDGRLRVNTGFFNDAGGFKHARVTTGSVGAGSTALVTITWATAFADTNYTVNASVLEATTSSLSMSVVHIESITAAAVTVRVLNNAVGSLTGTVHVIAVHD